MRVVKLLVIASVLVGCGGEETSDDVAEPAPDKLMWESAPFEVPAGETFTCFYTDVITDRELSVLSAAGVQGNGGHHVSLYYVDNHRKPGAFDCTKLGEMQDWHFVVGAGGEGNDTDDVATLPEGLAIKIPAGKQLLIQAHYINTTGAAFTQVDKLEVTFTDPKNVTAYASDFVVFNDAFEIPPMGSLSVTSTCEVEQDLQLALLIGHMHEQGVHYRLESVNAEGESVEVLYEEAWEAAFASHPPIRKYSMDAPLSIAKGTLLKQSCTWDNTTPQPLLFPTEMCIGFAYYFPGESRIMCEEE